MEYLGLKYFRLEKAVLEFFKLTPKFDLKYVW